MISLALMANASAAAEVMRSYITPLLGSLIGLASVAVVFFLTYGGIRYMTSRGDPEKLQDAKKILKNALIGLVLVIAAGTLTAILSYAYNGSADAPAQQVPILTEIKPQETSGGLVDVLIDAVVGLLKNIIQSIGKPFIDALDYFTEATPLMAENPSVFNMWLVVVAITDVLFVVVVALLGFHVMSASTFGLEEIELKHLLPRLALIFALINSSIFLIDMVIGLSNVMIEALRAGMEDSSVWKSLLSVVDDSGGLGLAALLIMIVFIILAVMLVVYYVLRIVILYIGAVLAPVLMLISLIPAFKDFAITAVKVYLTTIFVLFVHVVILLLAASIFTGMNSVGTNGTPNPIMAMVVGVATMLALLKTQAVMSQMSYVSLGPKTARKLGGQISNVISHYGKKARSRQGGGGHGQNDNKNRRQRNINPPTIVQYTPPPKRSTARKAEPKLHVGQTQRAPDITEKGSVDSTPRKAEVPPRTSVTPKIRKDKKE